MYNFLLLSRVFTSNIVPTHLLIKGVQIAKHYRFTLI